MLFFPGILSLIQRYNKTIVVEYIPNPFMLKADFFVDFRHVSYLL